MPDGSWYTCEYVWHSVECIHKILFQRLTAIGERWARYNKQNEPAMDTYVCANWQMTNIWVKMTSLLMHINLCRYT